MQTFSFLKPTPPGFSSYHQFSKASVLLVILFSFAALVNAQSTPPEKQWDKTFGGANEDALTSMVSTPDGGCLLGGYSASGIGGDKTAPNKGGAYNYDYWIIKLDKSGN